MAAGQQIGTKRLSVSKRAVYVESTFEKLGNQCENKVCGAPHRKRVLLLHRVRPKDLNDCAMRDKYLRNNHLAINCKVIVGSKAVSHMGRDRSSTNLC